MVIEGTMGDAAFALEQERKLRKSGYSVEYRILAVKPILSRLSTFNRYAEMVGSGAVPRFVTVLAHDLRFEGLKKTVEEISKQENVKLSFYSREIKGGIHGGFTDNVKALNEGLFSPVFDFKKQTGAPLTLHELDYVRTSISLLQKNGIPKNILEAAFPNLAIYGTRQKKI